MPENPEVQNPQPIIIESILESVKKILGLTKEYDAFDYDILTHINTVFSNITQMGIGPQEGFTITGYAEKWEDFTLTNPLQKQQIRSLVPLKVRVLFDPSANGNISGALDRQIAELEYRLYTEEGGY